MKHINSISCGQGAPSVYLIVMAGMGIFPADSVIVADTGWENDMLWNTGERTTAKEYFERVTRPLAESYGFPAFFVRAVDKNGVNIGALKDTQTYTREYNGLDLPMFGSEGGRLRQSCTSKYKKAAIRQQLRRLGAKTATTHLGLTMDEVHRVKHNTDVRWETLAWPMIESKYNHRQYKGGIRQKLESLDIPYILSTECDGCPHKNAARWLRTSGEMIAELTEFESKFEGDFFLTKHLIPLNEAVEIMKNDDQPSLFDGCDSGYCFT